MRKKFYLTAILFFLNVFLLTAADDLLQVPSSIGVYGGLNINMQSPSFTNATTSVKFDQNATSYSGNFGIIGLFPINETFLISARVGFNMLGGVLEKKVDPNTYELDASLNYIEVSPILQLHNLLPVRNLYFLAGAETGIPLSPKYSMKENSRGLVTDAKLPDANMRFAVILGAGYMFPLSKTIFLTPEASFRLPFTTVSKNTEFDSWNIPQVRIGLALTFGFSSPKTKTKNDVSGLEVGFDDIRYYDNEGNKYPLERIKVEDVQYTELFPLIPYVFCPEGKTSPSNQTQSLFGKSPTGEFSINSLHPDAFEINQSTLDIIGYRMKTNPNAELTITGANDSKTEAGVKDLSLERANFAKIYLVENYGINPEKINIKNIGLPAKPSTSNVPEGVEENRRIEFQSSNPSILEPIIIQRENQTLAEPNVIEFVPYAKSEDPIIHWQLEVNQAGKIIRNVSGEGEPGPVQITLIPNELTKSQIPLEYSFSARNAKDLYREVSGTIPIDYYSYSRKKTEELPDRTISKFSLVLFDFDKAEVSPQDMQIIEKNVLPAIRFNSTVKIYGYTDRIGDETYNRKLAERRANAVKDLLESKIKSAKYEVYGVGEQMVIYENNSPIGRQLSRTVQVHVITPK